ncbi:hypothetical protein ACFQZX_00845 [Mucilaginibacter litoreus]|uniref:Uncharacterized protein n=1 Tax=Mucilaginibacter litoreus TaxID=1048221 RepID=A0ABW3APE9_9SPHI
MTTKYLIRLFAICFILQGITPVIYAQVKDNVTQEMATEWAKAKSWSGGTDLKLHQSTNTIEFYRQYHANRTVWDKVFQFIKEQDLNTLAPGKYPIDRW